MPKSFRIQAGSDSIAFGAYKALDGHDVLLLDGGMGHELKQRGLEVDIDESLRNTFAVALAANLSLQDAVKGLHKEYLVAGADVITTNTFSCTQHSIEKAKLGDAQTEILEAACDICIDAIDEAKESGAARSDLVLLAGSLPPLKESYQTEGLPEVVDMVEEYTRIIEALNPCVDLFISETLSTVAEVKAVCAALSPTPRPLFLGVTVRDDGSNTLRSGEPLEAALDVAKGQSFVRGLLVNCCSAAAVSAALGPLKSAAEAIAEATGERVRFGGMANAFAVPTDVWLAGGGQGEGGADFDGGVMTAEAYGRRVAEWVQAGATLVGGCCGTTPAHIAEARKAVDAAGK